MRHQNTEGRGDFLKKVTNPHSAFYNGFGGKYQSDRLTKNSTRVSPNVIRAERSEQDVSCDQTTQRDILNPIIISEFQSNGK